MKQIYHQVLYVLEASSNNNDLYPKRRRTGVSMETGTNGKGLTYWSDSKIYPESICISHKEDGLLVIDQTIGKINCDQFIV